ncbi:hypothetical protein L3X38_030583 [Prunus dulcis]|uniref:COI1 F-box domain-containing protein n=1 Tax=Prunus dulcis TaxID=3755 RepID=A0AAD4VCP1_PRUDU|nr:hypothetical protein L3X38_030583 [Prunus dulcis]
MGIVEEAHNLRVLGSGQQVIVLAHGFGTDPLVWKHLVPHLLDMVKSRKDRSSVSLVCKDWYHGSGKASNHNSSSRCTQPGFGQLGSSRGRD